MKIELEDRSIRIVPENSIERNWLEDTFGLHYRYDSLTFRRVERDSYGDSELLYLEAVPTRNS
jgi:hypothetical protein